MQLLIEIGISDIFIENLHSPIIFEVSMALFFVHSFVLGPRSFLSVV